jgi:hypothetical protein
MTTLKPDQASRALQHFSDLEASLDFMIIDLPPGTDPSVLSFMACTGRRLLVIRGDKEGLADAYAMVKILCSDFHLDRIYIIVNAAKTTQEAQNLFNHLNTASTKFLNRELHYLGCIKQDELIVEAAENHKAVTEFAPTSQAAHDIRHLALATSELDRKQYAEGGVARFSGKRGNLTNSLDYYTDLLGGESERQIAEASKPIGGKGDAGIIRDADPDTAYLSAPEAAAVRMGKVNARANMQGLTLPRPKPINRLNLKPQGVKQAEAAASLDPEMAAHGGIMHSSLGGYAAGGNSRLLKGPGDGMSDNIPATIAGRQPARLADGEFVIPADVVSHLGNGSTEAGAKKLHEMMNKIRKARTGNPKQGKQINPNKFMPT